MINVLKVMKKNIIKKSIFILISIVAVLIIIIGTSYAFFSASHNSSSDSNVGLATISLDKVGTTTLDLTNKLPLEATIKSTGTISVLFRITPIIQAQDGTPTKINFHSIDNFVFDDIGTFYYTKILSPGQSVDFVYTFDIDTNYIDDDNNAVFIDYYVECVQYTADAYKEAFVSAPQEWNDIIDAL